MSQGKALWVTDTSRNLEFVETGKSFITVWDRIGIVKAESVRPGADVSPK